MNRPLSAFAGVIDLGREAPFRLASFEVIPAALELRRAGQAAKLEMRVMQVLVALHRRRGQTVSRDELSRLCWEGRIVGEDALNRSISLLRKALIADPAIQIETIPKLGYRLADEGSASADVAQGTAGAPLAARRRMRWLVLLAGLGIVAAIGFATMMTGRGQWTAEAMRPLTREAGVEIFPALSPDGRQLAYAAGAGFGSPNEIYLRGLSVGETRPLRLTATPADETAPAWSRSGERLAFVRSFPGRPCAIIVMSPPNGPEREAGRCLTDGTTSLAWLGDDELIFSDRSAPGEPRRLYAMDVASGSLRPLTSPAKHMIGDSQPSVSPDGRRLVFRRTLTTGNDDAYMLELANGTAKPITGGGGWKALGFAWSSDSGTVFITTNREGDFGLWALDAGNREAPRRVSLGLLKLGRMSQDDTGNLAVETSRTRANLVAVSAAGTAAITTASGNDWDPDVSASGSVLFASDVSGRNELWVKHAGQEPSRLTDFGGSYVYSPRWAPGGKEIAFIGVANRQADIYRVRSDGSGLARLTTDGSEKGSLAWSSSPAELLYTTRKNGHWQIARLSRDGRQRDHDTIGEGILVLRRSPDGSLFGRREDGSIVKIAMGKAGRLAAASTGIMVPDAEAWSVGAAGIFWLHAGASGKSEVRRTSWDGTTRPVVEVRAAHRMAFTVTPAGTLVTPTLLEDESDLVLLRPERRGR